MFNGGKYSAIMTGEKQEIQRLLIHLLILIKGRYVLSPHVFWVKEATSEISFVSSMTNSFHDREKSVVRPVIIASAMPLDLHAGINLAPNKWDSALHRHISSTVRASCSQKLP